MPWFISSFFILIKGALTNHIILKSVDVDLAIVIIVYLMAFYGEAGAAAFAFSQGLMIDIFSGGMLGLFTLIYMIAFLCVKFISRPLDLFSTGGQMSIIWIAVLVKYVLMVALLSLFFGGTVFSFRDILIFLFSALCTGIIAPFLFYFLNYLYRLFMKVDMEA